ncbi:MAG TPA: flagellar basal body rod protein FlgB [Fimbriimonadaceae bacterium]|nr:flagellar basal body rod protein FlgB [Fimbriimonadaceae bacterium]HRJ95384.1 flagellar basal body rod protein FlgB [Fimbriimonadaceae bacterium]
MLDNLFHPNLNNLTRALQRTRDRQGMLMANLANVNTPGYKRQDIDFAIELERAEGRPSVGATRMQERLARSTANRVDGSTVDLEVEVFGLAETELRYRTLTEMTTRYFSGLKNVIREGR